MCVHWTCFGVMDCLVGHRGKHKLRDEGLRQSFRKKDRKTCLYNSEEHQADPPHSAFLVLPPLSPLHFPVRPSKPDSPNCRSHDAASILRTGSTAASRIVIHAKVVSHLMGNGSSNTNGIIRVVLCKVKEASQRFTCACPMHLGVISQCYL